MAFSVHAANIGKEAHRSAVKNIINRALKRHGGTIGQSLVT
jgi:hypothetical protein